MVIERVRDAGDPRLEEYRSIRDPELLRRRGLFIAEGRLVVQRLLELDGRGHRVTSLLVNEAALAALARGGRWREDLPAYVCDTTELERIVGFDLHRGCLALAERPAGRGAAEVIARAEVLLVLEGISDPTNVGGVFRNAAAFGAGGVLLSPACCDPLYRKAVRTSMGAALTMPYARLDGWPDDLDQIRRAGFTLLALTPRADAVALASCRSRDERSKIALLVGNEGEGLSPAAVGYAHLAVRIPMSAGVDSLNVATATGVALYALTV